MTQALHRLAAGDTPSNVEVPQNPYGVTVWALGRFGIGMVFLALFWFKDQDNKVANERVYQDMKANTERVMQTTEKRAESDLKLADALTGLTRIVDEVRKEAELAHRNK